MRRIDWYAGLVRPWLFRQDAEHVHEAMVDLLASLPVAIEGLLARATAQPDPALHQQLWGIAFAHPLGLAAGLDKDARAVGAFSALGFSHLEVGTVTGQAQPGNPAPRLFRLRQDQAIINRMGFNNHGAAAMRLQLASRFVPVGTRGPRPRVPLGINLGKSKVVAIEHALDDYRRALAELASYADYVVVNVSSPNTPGLRDLQDEARLRPLLEGVRRDLARLAPGTPLLVKIAPDLSTPGLDAAVDAAREAGCDGLILTNTTIARDRLGRAGTRAAAAIGAGGLSGPPLRLLAERALAQVARRLRREPRPLPLIGVGGIDSPEVAWRRIGLGASLLQVYTGLVYHGPGLVGGIVAGLGRRLRAAGLASVADAVGRDL